MRNSGVLLKKVTAVLLVLGILAVLITLITSVSPLGEEINKIMSDPDYRVGVSGGFKGSGYGYYMGLEEELEALNEEVGAAWLSAGVSLVAVLVGCLVLYVLGDIADNVWIMTHEPSAERKV